MSIHLTRNESAASRRVIPLWCVGSNGTTPASSEAGGQPTWMIGGVYYGATTNTLSAWSANAGEYFVTLTQSETSVLGQGVVRYSSAGALETATPFAVVAVDSFDSTRAGLVALPNAAAEAAGGLVTFGTGAGQLHVSSGSVGLKAQTHSQVTIQGVTLLNSGVTLNPAVHSAATIQGVTLLNSSVTLNAGIHSGATVGGVAASGIAAGTFTTGAWQEGADRFLSRNISTAGDGTRTVQEALRVLRNRVEITGSLMTVYSEDDQSSSWTASVSTSASASPIIGVNPAGGNA
jgi:hypothetical protein